MAFLRESFSHRLYWYFYLSYGLWAVSGAIGVFNVFRILDIGLSLKELGMIAGITGVASTILLIPAGQYVDKKHPIRVGLYAMIGTLVVVPLNLIFLADMPHRTALIATAIVSACSLPIGVIFTASEIPLYMRLLPHSRFGQFCSANSLFQSVLMIIAGTAAGCFADGLKVFCQGIMHIPGDYYYRLIPIWQIVFVALALFFRIKLYRMWLKLGGDDCYLPPRFEEEERELMSSMHGRESVSTAINSHDS